MREANLIAVRDVVAAVVARALLIRGVEVRRNLRHLCEDDAIIVAPSRGLSRMHLCGAARQRLVGAGAWAAQGGRTLSSRTTHHRTPKSRQMVQAAAGNKRRACTPGALRSMRKLRMTSSIVRWMYASVLLFCIGGGCTENTLPIDHPIRSGPIPSHTRKRTRLRRRVIACTRFARPALRSDGTELPGRHAGRGGEGRLHRQV